MVLGFCPLVTRTLGGFRRKVSKYNKGHKYLHVLTVVDVFSKHAWVEPIKNKMGQTVTEAFEKILKQDRTPIQLQMGGGIF